MALGNRTYSNLLQNIVPIYYFLGTLISITYFNIFHPISLSSLGIFLVYYFIKFLNDFRVNKYILFFILIHVILGVFYRNIDDLFTMTLYSLVIFAFSMAAKFDKKIYEKFSLSIVLMNFINTVVLILSPASRTRYKTIGGLSIQINYFEDVHFSVAALTALLAIILIFKFKKNGVRNNLLIIGTVVFSLYNIITLGKVSVLLGLLVSIFITRFFFYKHRSQMVTKIIANTMIIFTFLSGWILEIVRVLTSSWNINYALFTGRRNMIWSVYLDYFSDLPILNKLFGSFFIRTYSDIVQPGLPHPHNQWITILISMGFVGLILYFLLLRRAYYYTIETQDKVGFAYMVAINVFATTDNYILLTAGCLNAFLIFYFATKSQNNAAINKKYHQSENGLNEF